MIEFEEYLSKAEQQAVRAMLKEVIKRGYMVSINCGEEVTVKAKLGRPIDDLLCGVGWTGEDSFTVYTSNKERIGSFYALYQRSDARDEVFHDYSYRVATPGAKEIMEEIWKIAGRDHSL